MTLVRGLFYYIFSLYFPQVLLLEELLILTFLHRTFVRSIFSDMCTLQVEQGLCLPCANSTLNADAHVVCHGHSQAPARHVATLVKV